MISRLLLIKANHGDLSAMLKVADAYYFGNTAKQDYAKAIEMLQKIIEMHPEHSYAYYRIGMCYKNIKDVQRGFQMIRKAAELGSPLACHEMGEAYYFGNGIVEKDINKAISYYQYASDNGNVPSLYAMAMMYRDGEGVEKDLERSAMLLERAAGAGYCPAQASLGSYYQYGVGGVPQSIEKAVQLYLSADNADNETACFSLAYIYFYGPYRYKTDATKADFYKKKAAHLGGVDVSDIEKRLAERYNSDKKSDNFAKGSTGIGYIEFHSHAAVDLSNDEKLVPMGVKLIQAIDSLTFPDDDSLKKRRSICRKLGEILYISGDKTQDINKLQRSEAYYYQGLPLSEETNEQTAICFLYTEKALINLTQNERMYRPKRFEVVQALYRDCMDLIKEPGYKYDIFNLLIFELTVNEVYPPKYEFAESLNKEYYDTVVRFITDDPDYLDSYRRNEELIAECKNAQ